MTTPSLLERLKQARIVQVLLVYLGASWVVLQFVDTLVGLMSLPDWVGPVAVVLMAIGLMVVLATAWVQSLPATTAKEEAGEIPTDWEVAPAQAFASLKAGKLPHLTWGRAILGGVVALSLLFGGTGLYVGFTGRTLGIGPMEVGADMAAEGIAVVPFAVTGGADLDLWREGMVDLLATNLDGVGGFRTIDSRTVMARWREKVPADDAPDLRTSLEAAGGTGARYGVVGTLVGNPAGIRLSADIYDLDTGEKVASGVQEGPTDQVLDLAGALSVGLARDLIAASGQELVQGVRLGAVTTASLPALRAYLEGEAAFRHADFAAAASAYERAVEQDSTFALAWARLADASGWLEDIGSAAHDRALGRAIALQDRLPARDRLIVQAARAAGDDDVSFYPTIRDAVQRYPDDPDLWYQLGEVIYHVVMDVGISSQQQAEDAYERAVALDPGFSPYQVHPMEFAILRGDRAQAEERLARYRESTADERNVTETSLAIPLLLGDSAEAAEAVERSLALDVGTVNRVRLAYTNKMDRYDRIRAMLWANRNRAGADHQWIEYSLIAEGALTRSDRLLDTLDMSAGIKGLAMGYALGSWPESGAKMAHRAAIGPQSCEQPSLNTACQYFMGWGLARSGDLSGAAESLRILRRRASEVEGDAAAARTRYADLVEGTLAAAKGQDAEARRLLAPLAERADNPGFLSRIPLSEVELRQGNVPEAIRYLEAVLATYNRMTAAYALAQIHEERGEREEALRLYSSFLTITRAGDQDLPEIVEAKAALARLGG